MKASEENICKFVTRNADPALMISNFVLERNQHRMRDTKIRPNNGMHLAISGTARLISGNGSHVLSPGTLFFTFAGCPCRLEAEEDFQHLYISFRGGRADAMLERCGIHAGNCVFEGFSGLISFWQNAISRADSRSLDLISEGVLLYTFSQVEQLPVSGEDAVTGSVLRYIEENYADAAMSLSACAEALGYHPKYISRLFKQKMGVNFSEYLKNIRIRHAVFLIEQGVHVIKNVALLSGYADQTYFSAVFRQCVGCSPTEYIKRINTTAKENEHAEN